MGKSVWLHSSDGPNTTTIDGEGVRRGIFCANEETAKTLIEGFTIRNCDATEFDYFEDGTLYRLGGGLLIRDASPSMVNCIFESNNAGSLLGYGGGMFTGSYVGICEATFTDCTINGNSCESEGGGGVYLYAASISFQSCEITNNTADWGGGVLVNIGSVMFENCTVTYNTDNGIEIWEAPASLANTTVCGNYVNQIVGDWTDNGGNFVADTCSGDPTGACCIGTSCSIGTNADCSAAGGTYLGDGSSCSGDPCGAGSTVWTVDDSGGADFYDIQSAVNAALNGDEILVYPGTYTSTGDNVVDMMGKARLAAQ